jgi:NAD-dependent dihydropyrimidine dehydrogenase PreA subunit
MPKGEDWTRKELEEEILSKYRAVTIPVDVRFEGKHRVLDMSAVEGMLRSAKLISLADCSCREKVKGCERPLDVCLCIDSDAEELIEKKRAKKVTLPEALVALKRASEAGLVHVSYLEIGKDRPQIFCSCCTCCCHSMAALVRFGYSDAVVRSDRIALQDESLCDSCGICVERCQFGAREITDKTLAYDSSRCFGCGVCISSCPVDAITLGPR